MHFEHDHQGMHNHEHTHEHSHEHTHAHTHDGVEHTHSHVHGHSHDHEHPHSHEHLHEDGCAHEHSHASMQQLVALISYMESHNAAHTNELADLAKQLDQAGNHNAYHKLLDAVALYQQGNQHLSAVLAALKNN